jgi:catechol-2,3-dioxygenase
MSSVIRPSSFAHVVYRTYRFEEMLEWYGKVFGATVQHRSPAIAFLTYDGEHHRVALLNLELIKPDSTPSGVRAGPGVDHVAYGFDSLSELLANYERLAALGITPYWAIHHGVTVSLYYADPDGNQMEFQVDSFTSVEAANDFMQGPHFEANPIGVEFEPKEMLAGLRAGVAECEFLTRQCDLPVPPIRGSMAL